MYPWEQTNAEKAKKYVAIVKMKLIRVFSITKTQSRDKLSKNTPKFMLWINFHFREKDLLRILKTKYVRGKER